MGRSVVILLLAAACSSSPAAGPIATATAEHVTQGAPTPSPSPSPTPAPRPTESDTTPSPAASPTAKPSPPAVTTVPVRIERRTSDAATAGFEQDVLDTLTDQRGWIRAGFDFPADDEAEYRIVLAEGDEVDELCLPYDTYGSYSCQNGPVVAINADRWRTATPEWTASIAQYRIMLINHEVGHLLHLHHPRPQCPGAGWPAPVMAQQSTELGACEPNPWPLPWEIDLAAERREPLAPPADHEVRDHRPRPPRQRHDESVAS